MRTNFCTLLLLLCAGWSGAVDMVIPDKPLPGELTAQKELKEYFAVTVDELCVNGDKIEKIYLGETDFAKQNQLSNQKMKRDDFIIKKIDDAIVINGGGTRGTLYGVYSFLEDIIGIRFWSPVEIDLPLKRKISVDSVDRDFKFFFPLRDIGVTSYPDDGGKNPIARGFSRSWDRVITPEFGGSFGYGPPYACHTFDHYFPTSKYLETNPDFFSLRDGKRVGGQYSGQLCLTNQKLREFFLQLLLNNIKTTTEQALAQQIEPPVIYDVSQNDNVAFCQCESCTALAAKENQSGVLIDFINYLAENIEKQYPEVRVQTFAYLHTLEPPVSIKPRDNVIVRICNTYSDQITGGCNNPVFVRHIENWHKITDNLAVWDYAITFAKSTGLPYPSEYYYPQMYRFYADHDVKSLVWEQEYPERNDMHVLKFYLLSKYMQDPYRQDFESLLSDFYSRYYGDAGQYIRAYRELLLDAAQKGRSYIGWMPNSGDFQYIDWQTMLQSQKLFEKARHATAGNSVLTFRVNRAAMGMDRLLGFELLRRYQRQFTENEPGKSFPFDVAQVRQRFLDTWEQSRKLNGDDPYMDIQTKALAQFESMKKLPLEYREVPKFQSMPHLDFVPLDLSCVLPEIALELDPTSVSGCAAVIPVAGKEEAYRLPMGFGVNTADSNALMFKYFDKNEFKPNRYNWITLENIQLPEVDCSLWMTNCFGVQIALKDIEPLTRTKPINIHISIKMQGPLYFENETGENKIFIDRVVITQAKDNTK